MIFTGSVFANDNLNSDNSTKLDVTKTNTSPALNSSNVSKSSHNLAAGEKNVKVSFKLIYSASVSIKKYVSKNGRLPNYVSINGNKVAMSDVLYLQSKAILNYKNGKTGSINIEYINNPKSPSSSKLIKGSLTKNDYIKVANAVINNINKNGAAPNYVTTKLGKIQFQTIVYGFSKVVAAITHRLPNYLTLNIKSSSNINKKLPVYNRISSTPSIPSNPPNISTPSIPSTPSTPSLPSAPSTPSKPISLSIDEIKLVAINLKDYMDKHNFKLPNSITIGSKEYNSAQYLYLLSTAINNINNKDISNITVITVKQPSSPLATNIKKDLSKTNYLDLSLRVSNFIKSNGVAPNYASSDLGRIGFLQLIDGFSNVLLLESNGSLPTYMSFVPMTVYNVFNLDKNKVGVEPLIEQVKELTIYSPFSVMMNSTDIYVVGAYPTGSGFKYQRYNVHIQNFFNGKWNVLKYEQAAIANIINYFSSVEGMLVYYDPTSIYHDMDFDIVGSYEHRNSSNFHLNVVYREIS
ncbi:pseudomurein-binding repeat-containing protein [Methanobrevibacter curvatus]|uniref:Pseudomurein-binding repeat protein n=1 Tax=Methanobrevibacter curvatus TaxID=49547 RepID=A0A166C1F9_9EURY|nr:pseudomurein-binding repeat-containing protein [Methanobrevibacter curvatus]KZX14031.1 pseudomurein-binding repeat protein [Methanobrevibacter curvatus]